MSTERSIYGITLDVAEDRADGQTAKAFRDIRAVAIELEEATGDGRLLDLVGATLSGSSALREALILPHSKFMERVAGAGAQACSSAASACGLYS